MGGAGRLIPARLVGSDQENQPVVCLSSFLIRSADKHVVISATCRRRLKRCGHLPTVLAAWDAHATRCAAAAVRVAWTHVHAPSPSEAPIAGVPPSPSMPSPPPPRANRGPIPPPSTPSATQLCARELLGDGRATQPARQPPPHPPVTRPGNKAAHPPAGPPNPPAAPPGPAAGRPGSCRCPAPPRPARRARPAQPASTAPAPAWAPRSPAPASGPVRMHVHVAHAPQGGISWVGLARSSGWIAPCPAGGRQGAMGQRLGGA